jgi:hypothetical protein
MLQYALRTARFPVNNPARIKLTHYPSSDRGQLKSDLERNRLVSGARFRRVAAAMIASWDMGQRFPKRLGERPRNRSAGQRKRLPLALLRLGTAAMTETSAGYFWIGFGPIFAGMVLFAWNLATIVAIGLFSRRNVHKGF